MVKKIISIAICLIIVFSFAPVAFAQTQTKITQNYQAVDNLDGVTAYYRPGNSDNSNATYSCAAFTKNYFSKVYGVTISGLGTSAVPGVSKGVLRAVSSPQKGDLVYWPFQHSAIVKYISGNNVVLIEQNWKWTDNKGGWYTYKERSISKSAGGLKFYRWSKN